MSDNTVKPETGAHIFVTTRLERVAVMQLLKAMRKLPAAHGESSEIRVIIDRCKRI
jgi:hypothetical protein